MPEFLSDNTFPYFGYIFAVISVLPQLLLLTIFKPKFRKVEFKTEDKKEKILEIANIILYVLNILMMLISNKAMNVRNVGLIFGISLFFYCIYYEMFFRFLRYGRAQKLLYKRFIYVRVPFFASLSLANLFVAIWSKNILYIIVSTVFGALNIYIANAKYMKYFTEYRELYAAGRKTTNKKMLKDAIQPKGLKFVTVAVFIYNTKTHKFLMQKRTVDKGGKYGTTSGHPVYGQTSLEGMCSEIKEELGIDVDSNSLKLIDTIERKKKYVDIYYMETESRLENISIQKEELNEIKWMSKKEIDMLYSKNKFKKTHYKYFNTLLDNIKIK